MIINHNYKAMNAKMKPDSTIPAFLKSTTMNEQMKPDSTIPASLQHSTMNEHMKQVKFKVLVQNIYKALYIITPENTTSCGTSIFGLTAKVSAGMQRAYEIEKEKQGSLNRSYKVGPLNLIFNSQNANDYLKVILSNASFVLRDWYYKYGSANFNDLSVKIAATQELISEFKADTEKESLRFIFWLLFAVSVDKTDYEDKVSLIADFAHMLEIDEKTIRDITQVIKVIFGEEEEGFEFQTDAIPSLFSGVLKLFEN